MTLRKMAAEASGLFEAFNAKAAKPRNFLTLAIAQLAIIYSRKALFITGMDAQG